MITNRERFFKKHNIALDKSLSLPEIAKLSNMPIEALREVFNRGIGAYKTNPESVRVKGTFLKDADAPLSQKLSKEQWAYARVYAFVSKSPKVYRGSDNDIRKQFGLN